MLDLSPRGRWFGPRRRHYVVSFSKTHLSQLLSPGAVQESSSVITETLMTRTLRTNPNKFMYNFGGNRVVHVDQDRRHCGSTKCSPTQYAPFSSILCTLHTQYAPLEHFVYPAYTICYQRSILCRVGTYVISVVVRGYTICSS